MDEATYASLLRQCVEPKSLRQGQLLHAEIWSSSARSHTFLNNLIVQMYGKCGCIPEAKRVFDSIPLKNVYSWNLMLAAYAQNGHLLQALQIFDMAPVKTVLTWNSMLSALIRNNELQKAKDMFDSMPQRDVVSWNTLLSAYAQSGYAKRALKLLLAMDLEGVFPNSVTFVSGLSACTTAGEFTIGKIIHYSAATWGFDKDVIVASAIVNLYGKCGDLSSAKSNFDSLLLQSRDEHVRIVTWNTLLSAYTTNNRVREAKLTFDAMPERDRVSWNLMILVHAKNGQESLALDLFRKMDLEGIAPDNATFVQVLDICTFEEGQVIHRCCLAETSRIRNLMVATAVLDLYGKCGKLDDAREVFDGMSERDLVAWNAMLGAYAQSGHVTGALHLLGWIYLEGMHPNESTFVSLVSACTAGSARPQGEFVHKFIVEVGYTVQDKVWNALLNMYAKLGNLVYARSMLDEASPCDVVPWNTMVGAYARLGHTQEALALFHSMLGYGVTPTHTTFTSVLCACSHVGLLEDAHELFVSQQRDFGLVPISDHYNCMMDVLCRSGRLEDAHDLIRRMPFEPAAPAWAALLSSCRTHGNLQLAATLANEALEGVLEESGAYVSLSNMFRDALDARP